MNIRSLTRGDGVVIGAAVLLFIASFLDVFAIDDAPDSMDLTTAWDSGPLLFSVTLAGIIGAACIVLGRGLPQAPKVAGIDLATLGTAFTVFAAWSALGQIFDPSGGVNNLQGAGDGLDAGIGLILSLIATLAMAGGAIASLMVPALKAPLLGAGGPAPAPQPYGGPAAPQQGGYGYPNAQQGAPSPFAQQQPQPFGGQPAQPGPGAGAAQPAPAAGGSADFAPFWFAVPVARPLYAEDGSSTTIAELAPGTWYLAVEQRGQALVAQTQDGRRGVLQDTTGIQRG
ncbi:hypothetical protein ACQUSR_24125 [Streptomyces sp. P1-3]|uniref:hypothetical protein n=1 Tax=Streptomyces sp. P1-3 TaxID=3421658 RepID=UPI003D35A7F6